jgi:erythromycin esterase-like protein
MVHRLDTSDLAGRVRDAARLFPTEDASGYDALLDKVGDARFVLIGEASHGTHEFYAERAAITRRLIEERGFAAVAAEADWPDAYCVNRYVRGLGGDPTAYDALAGFERFPQWMWRNPVVVEFAEWLRARNAGLAPSRQAGFYGVDLYSLHDSVDAVLSYLARVDPEAAGRARTRYRCFDHFGEDAQAYGYATAVGRAEPCEDAVVAQLLELQHRREELAGSGRATADELFAAEMNASVVANAERYYRSMFRGRHSSWNLRDTHMADTLGALSSHLERQGAGGKVVVWAHNSHLGDARATEMGDRGELNLGQLVRQRYGDDAAYLVGFTTHTGTVTAASDWGDPAERKAVRPGREDSYEGLLHATGIPRFWLDLRDDAPLARLLASPRLERAIGVIYRPETERQSHYFHAQLADQFDAVIHIDETRALEPLERTAAWEAGEPAETYPSGV